MSIKVMIVDDEYIILDGLSSFPWNEYGCELIATAQNGREGIQKVQEYEPDIVFTDIKMPEMDGLEFASAAKKIKEKLKIVLLTGYDNFEFAQEAIRLGISEYLLKPMNFMKLDDLVKKLCSELNEERKISKYYMDLQKSFEKELPYIRSKFVNDLFHGRIRTRKELEHGANTVDIHIEKYICIAITRENAHSGREDAWPEQYAFLNIGVEILGEFCMEVLCEYDDMNLQFNFILLFQRDNTEKYCVDQSIVATEKLKQVANEVIHYKICIGISNVETDVYKVNEKHIEACQACSQSVYLGENTIVSYKDLDDVVRHNHEITQGQKQRLFIKIYAGQTLEANKDIEEMFGEQDMELNDCKYMALDLLVACMRYPFLCRIKGKLQEEYDYLFLQDGIKVISNAESVNEIVQYLTKGFTLLTTQNNKNFDERYQNTVNHILDYLNENYNEDLTLDCVADKFHMSKTYVSRILKRYTNQSFLQLLICLRMDAARKMIVEDKYKLYEIAERVGYNDFSYFIQAFKKKYGVTPNEYRKGI
ncbi:response regulator transcription factor [Kineothrix sp. MB12-C1]|uniref:response regulator transcription factor n=1 Tax=Kineothrix sp. MB12-C1 TaxID=3070215 RepID=UPI0027D22166|nr:response regulator [Kineothrix sp. MB12-C1]WMC93249.1 response regulator [Kineothrix sp. MB12-C1]